jgi:hypothetical protein
MGPNMGKPPSHANRMEAVTSSIPDFIKIVQTILQSTFQITSYIAYSSHELTQKSSLNIKDKPLNGIFQLLAEIFRFPHNLQVMFHTLFYAEVAKWLLLCQRERSTGKEEASSQEKGTNFEMTRIGNASNAAEVASGRFSLKYAETPSFVMCVAPQSV